ncbi:MAG: type II toxin-antitoxin system VapC family toxin [Chloroflexi bacterium]|nr:type II toxin-antitoxin system VapC family toxin [Chloroflexota bacterium]
MKRAARSLPDTNIIIRYLISDDPAVYAKAKGFFDLVKHGGTRAIILESVIAECVYVLMKVYKVPRDRAAGSLIDILRYKGIANEDQQELIDALTLFSEGGLDIVDCILCAKASASGDELLTFDADLIKMKKKSKRGTD